PLHGFNGADDYWRRASSKPWLKAVTVPTLVLNARNDPFIPAASLPTRAEASAAITLEQPEGGGHGGFPHEGIAARLDWLPRRVVAFFSGKTESRERETRIAPPNGPHTTKAHQSWN